VKAPQSRIASQSEIADITNAANNKLKAGTDPRKFVWGLGQDNAVLVAEKSSGRTFEDVLQNDPHTSKGKFGGAELNKESILSQLIKQQGPIMSLAKSIPADAVMGMGDRILMYFNAQNFLWDATTNTFNYVDNTQNIDGGFISTTVQSFGTYTGEESFKDWAKKSFVKDLKSDIPGLAAKAFTNAAWTAAGKQVAKLNSRQQAQNQPPPNTPTAPAGATTGGSGNQTTPWTRATPSLRQSASSGNQATNTQSTWKRGTPSKV
jgi:hypothetical protein